MKYWFPISIYWRLEYDPRSTPGHSKVLDQIRAIMKLMIVVSTDKKVALMLHRCAETFKITSEISKSKLVLIHALFEIWTLHPIKNEKLKGCMTTEIRIVSSMWPVASTIKPKSIKGVVFGIGTTGAFWGCANGNWAAHLQFSKSILFILFIFNRVLENTVSFYFDGQFY